MVLTELVRVFDRFDKINHRLHFYCTIDRSSSLNCTVYLSFKSGILLQQPIAPLKGVFFAHFSNMYCTILKEMRGREIFDLGPILLKLGRAAKMAVFWSSF